MELPTRESEFLRRNDPIWEFGFYEPPLDKIPKGKLMFREVMELLRTTQEVNIEKDSEAAIKLSEEAQKRLESHVAYERIGKEKLDVAFQYFRPFERKDTQNVVSKRELAQLQDILQGRNKDKMIDFDISELQKRFQGKDIKEHEKIDNMDTKEKKEFLEAVKLLRIEEDERLSKRLKSIQLMEEEKKEAFEEAMKEKKKTDEKTN